MVENIFVDLFGVKGEVNKIGSSIGSMKVDSKNIKVTFSKNELACLSNLEESIESFKSKIEEYATGFERNLDELLDGVASMQDIDEALAQGLKSANEKEPTIIEKNSKYKLEGF